MSDAISDPTEVKNDDPIVDFSMDDAIFTISTTTAKPVTTVDASLVEEGMASFLANDLRWNGIEKSGNGIYNINYGSDDGDGDGDGEMKHRRKKPRRDVDVAIFSTAGSGFFEIEEDHKEIPIEKPTKRKIAALAASRTFANAASFPLRGKIVVIITGTNMGRKARVTGKMKNGKSEQYRLSVFGKHGEGVKSQTVMIRSSFEVCEEEIDFRGNVVDAVKHSGWFQSPEYNSLVDGASASPPIPLPSRTYNPIDTADGLYASQSSGRDGKDSRRIRFYHHPDGDILHTFTGPLQAARLLNIPRPLISRCINKAGDGQRIILCGFYILEEAKGSTTGQGEEAESDDETEPSDKGTLVLSQLRRHAQIWEAIVEKSVGKAAGDDDRYDDSDDGYQEPIAEPTAPVNEPSPGEVLLCDCCDSEVTLEAAGLEGVPEGDWFCTACREKDVLMERKEDGFLSVYAGDRDAQGRPHGRGVRRVEQESLGMLLGWKYEGEWADGKLSGEGKLKLNTGDSYSGSFLNGKCHGTGTWKYFDFNEYQGQWVDGLFSGEGIMRYDDGSSYQGSFNEGYPHGMGTCKLAIGGVYIGEWAWGQRCGRGKMRSADQNYYDGHWEDDMFEGKGALKLSDGMVFRGDFSKNKPHGQGKCMYANGDLYEGGWENGKKHGHANFSQITGVTYVGEFMNGKKHGQGKITAQGNSYEGEFRANEWHGLGVATFADGSRYEGHFFRGYFQGMGTFTFPVADDAPGDTAVMHKGRYHGGKRNGQGSCKFVDGGEYSGPWSDGQRETRSNQSGSMMYADGTIYSGEWRANKREGRGILKLPDGTRYTGQFLNDQYHGYGLLSTPVAGRQKPEILKGYWLDGQFDRLGDPPQANASRAVDDDDVEKKPDSDEAEKPEKRSRSKTQRLAVNNDALVDEDGFLIDTSILDDDEAYKPKPGAGRGSRARGRDDVTDSSLKKKKKKKAGPHDEDDE